MRISSEGSSKDLRLFASRFITTLNYPKQHQYLVYQSVFALVEPSHY